MLYSLENLAEPYFSKYTFTWKKKSLGTFPKHFISLEIVYRLESIWQLPGINFISYKFNCHGDNPVNQWWQVKCLISAHQIRGSDQHSIVGGTQGNLWNIRATVLPTTAQDIATTTTCAKVDPYHTETPQHAIYQDMFLHFPDKLLKVHVLQKSTNAAVLISQRIFGLAGAERFTGWERLTCFSFSGWDVHLSRCAAAVSLGDVDLSETESWGNAEGVRWQWKGRLESWAAYNSWCDTLDGATIVLSLDRFTKQTQSRVGMLNSNPAP